MPLDIKIGADPELFVKKKGRKTFTSAHGMVQGTKDEPFKVDKGAVQVDGMALEFNIEPAVSEEDFIGNIEAVTKALQEMVPEYELVPTPTADFTAAHIAAQPEEALELGCDPDFDAWNGGKPNPKPDAKVNFRTGAGHIHIGWCDGVDINNPEHLEACQMVTKQLDWTVGLLSTMFDKDERRRSMYGNWGAYRPKPYGVEYRVLSNAWLKDKRLMSWVYRMVVKAVRDLEQGRRYYAEATKPDTKYLPVLIKHFGLETPPEVV